MATAGLKLRRRISTTALASFIALGGLVLPAHAQAQTAGITATVMNGFYCSTVNYRCVQVNGRYNPSVGSECRFVYFRPIRGTVYTTVCTKWA